MNPNAATSGISTLARVFWMMLGPLALAVLGLHIVNSGSGWFTVADFVFLAFLGATILARWVEYRGGDPKTGTGEPATPAHLRRYVLATVLVGLAAWTLANLAGNHWLSQ